MNDFTDWWASLSWSEAMIWFIAFVFIFIVPIWVWLGVTQAKRHWERERRRVRSHDPRANRDTYRVPGR